MEAPVADRIDPEFYVGYVDRAPPRTAAHVRRAVVLLFALAIAVGLVLVASQSRFDRSVFEFGVVRSFDGVVFERPYPALLVERPAGTDTAGSFSVYDLTVPGKHGAGPLVAGLDGRPVSLSGSLIYHDGRTMIEVEEGSIETRSDPAAARRAAALAGSPVDLGERTLVGEIVDSKCYLGVMKPGRSKAHKSCAVRCISGGVPPMLRVTDENGVTIDYLLVDEHGAAVNDAVLDLVAEPVQITGTVRRIGDRLQLRANPTSYRSWGQSWGHS
jgi:hypothetical protein